MRVNFARALAAVIWVTFAGQALAEAVVISDVLVSKREPYTDSTPQEIPEVDAKTIPRAIPEVDAKLTPRAIPQVTTEPSASTYYSAPSDARFFTMGNETKVLAPDAQSESSYAAYNHSGNNSNNSCGQCNDFCAACDECPDKGLVLFSGIDSWRGVGDRGNIFNRPSNNDGTSFGFNYGARLGGFSDATGIGLQVGGSYALYDWNGRPFNVGTLTTTQVQQQAFFTVGLFKKANEESSWSYGVVHDWMFNQAWGAFAVNPTLGQWRGQIAYATSTCNEFGVWGTLRDKGATNLDSLGNPVSTRAIDQANLFWHHKWELGADSWFWVGIPQSDRLNQIAGGSLGDFLVGGSVIAPLNDYVSLYGNMQYMHPSAGPGSIGSGDASWYVAFGLQYTVGGNACTRTVAGSCWMPLLPVANNGNFLVDAVRTFGIQ